MPFEVKKKGNQYCVLTQGTGKSHGCHASKGEAMAQMRALYANVKDAQESIAGGGGPTSPKRRIERRMLVAQESLEFDENGDCIITIVRPGISDNGLEHTPEAIRQAVDDGIWNNSRMFLDHGEPGNMFKNPFGRKTMELVSLIKDTWVGDDKSAKGKVKFVQKGFQEFAQEAQDVLGVSMATWYEDGGKYRKDGRLITKVKKYLANRSVDWTPFPAAGGAIDEFLATESKNVEIDDLTLEELVAERPDLIDAAIAARASSSSGTQPQGGNPAPAVESLSEAKVATMINAAVESRQNAWEADRTKEREAREKVGTMLSESGLPIKTQRRVAAQFDGQLEVDETKVNAAVESAFNELAEVGFKKGPQITGNGNSTDGDADKKPATSEELDAKGYDTLVAVESAMGYTPAGSGAAE